MWYVTYRGVLALFLLMEWIFPQEYASLSESMDSSMAGLSYFGELLVVALTPAICEEALHRGLLQYSLRGIKKKWVMLLLMGVYFGAFHMSIVRFLPMMMMGIVLSYVRMTTDTMFDSSLFHFVHTASTIVASIAASFLYMFSQGNAAAGSGYATETYIYQKVKSGTLKGVSVGYMVEDWEEVAPNKVSMDGRFTGPCSIAKRWIPYEISIVSVPADPTVGVGRSMTADEAAAWNETYARQLQYNKNIARGGKSR